MSKVSMWPWRPIFWEPVSGTGERLMVGVLHGYGGEIQGIRTIRDDVLSCLFGKSAVGLRRLIDHGLSSYQGAARVVGSLDPFGDSMVGLFPGPVRVTEASSVAELLQTACLLYSSLGNLDRLDEAEESDSPQQDDVNKRFGSEVREFVLGTRPDLISYFSRSAVLVQGGQPVRFGFFSPRAVMHFTVIHPVRHSASMRDARAKIFEIDRARQVAGIDIAALIAAVPREDDATLGSKQREQLKANKIEIESEADSVGLRWYPVHNASDGADRLIELVS